MTDPDDPGVTQPDPALPTERTALAWTRTALTCAALAAVAMRLVDRETDAVLALGIGLLVACPGLLASWLRLRDLRTGPPHPPPRAVVTLLAATVALVDLAIAARMVTRL